MALLGEEDLVGVVAGVTEVYTGFVFAFVGFSMLVDGITGVSLMAVWVVVSGCSCAATVTVSVGEVGFPHAWQLISR